MKDPLDSTFQQKRSDHVSDKFLRMIISIQKIPLKNAKPGKMLMETVPDRIISKNF